MKKVILSMLVVFIGLCTYGQDFDFTVSQETHEFGDGKHPSISINIYEAEPELIEKMWKSQLKGLKAKVKSGKREIIAMGAVYDDMGHLDFNVISFVKEEKEFCRLVTAIDLGGAFLTAEEHQQKYEAYEKLLVKFAEDASKEGVKYQMSKLEKNIEKQEKVQNALVKQNEKLHAKIEDYKEGIKHAEQDIEGNEKDQESQKKIIQDSKYKLKEIEDLLKKI